MRVFVTGATGVIGRRLVHDRLARGDTVVALSRDADRAAALLAPAAGSPGTLEIVAGDPTCPGAWQRAVDGCDALVHLAGASITGRRWNDDVRDAILDSRLDGTYQVVEALRGAERPPSVFVSASATGWYGETGDEERDERAPADRTDFLGDVCHRWEAEASKARELGVRVVLLRIGHVLDPRGGVLPMMTRMFRRGLGGPVGPPQRFLPWVHWRDVVGLAHLALTTPSIDGPLNAVAPDETTSGALARALASALHRPCLLRLPAFGVRLALGPLGAYARQSQRIAPARALEAGYVFEFPGIDLAQADLVRDDAERAVPFVTAPVPAPEPDPGRGPAPASAGPVVPAPDLAIRLAAIGVDGTLLRSDGQLARGVLRACRAAVRDGCVLVLATSRPPRAVRGLVETLGIEAPIICYNGAVIWNPRDDRAQYHEALDAAVASEVVALARSLDPDVLVGVEVIDRWFTDRIDPSLAAPSGARIEPDDIGPLERFLATPVTQIVLRGSPERIAALRAAIGDRFWRDGRISLFRPSPSLLLVAHPLVDKGIALQRIAARLGVARDAVLAVGDDANDMGMIEWAGVGVAVANAGEAVRAIADAVVPSNDEQGVALALRRYGNTGHPGPGTGPETPPGGGATGRVESSPPDPNQEETR